MALTDEAGGMNTTMLVQPTGNVGGYPYPMFGGNSSGFGNGQDGWWIILFIILLASGGWNGNGASSNGTPVIINDGGSAVQRGFDQASLIGGINGVSAQIGGGFADVLQTMNANTNALQTQLYGNTIADLERSFAMQSANTQALNSLQSSLATCCCENRLATCQTQNIVQNEGNATRFADANNTRDIIDSQTRGIQAIMDKLCALEIDAKNDKIADLERQLTMANLSASQTAQTATIIADNTSQTQYLVNRISPYPIPAYIVAQPVAPTVTV